MIFEERELTLWRQRSLRLVKNVEPLLESIGKKREEGFTVGLLVQRFTAVCPQIGYLLDVRSKIGEAFRPHKETLRRLPGPG